MPKWMDDCVKKVKKDDPDLDDQQAWAICTAQYKKEFGHAPPREDLIVSVVSEELSFSQSEKRAMLQKAVHRLFGDDGDSLYAYSNAWIVDVYDEPMEIVVAHNDRLYAVPYSFPDRFTAELGEPYEVVSAYIAFEAEKYHYILDHSWLPVPAETLDDSDFAWVSEDWVESSKGLSGTEHRRLPFAVHGEVNTQGWLAAMYRLSAKTYLRPDLRGGPSVSECLERLQAAVPPQLEVQDDGTYRLVTESGGKDDVLIESCRGGLVVEEAKADSGFAFMVSGTVVPSPNNKHGSYSKNRRLYPGNCIRESYHKSLEFMAEDTSTVHVSHTSYVEGRLPVGKVVELGLEDGALTFRAGIAPTAEGVDLKHLVETGVLDKVSLRTREWKSRWEEVGDLGRVEVVDWFILHGVDFTEVPGLGDTKVVKEEFKTEEETMDWGSVTLADLQEQRPDLVAELLENVEREEIIKEVVPAGVARKLEILEASNTGVGSLVAKHLLENLGDDEELTEEALQEARDQAMKTLYEHHTPAPPANAKGESVPADQAKPPEPASSNLSESQRAMLAAAGGTLTE